MAHPAALKPYRPYRDELRRVFVIYALTPVILLAMVTYALLVFWGYRMIESRTRDNARNIAAQMGAELAVYTAGLKDLARHTRLSEILSDTPPVEDPRLRVELYNRLYSIPAKSQVKSTFSVFGPQGQPIMSDTHTLPAYAANITTQDFGWGVFGRMNQQPDRVAGVVTRSHTPLRGVSVLSLGHAVRGPEGDIRGYVLFDLLEEDLAALLHRPEVGEVVVTDLFHNVLVSTSRDFIDEFGKLRKAFRTGDSYVPREGETSFVGKAQADLGDEVGALYVYSISASSYFQTIALNGALFLGVVFAVIIALILIWSRHIAVRKARAVEALAEVIESGGSLAIPDEEHDAENNEFRGILHAYRGMLADIQRLMAQNEEELQRAMRAEVKHLEAQFNPHLIYNTLETVRCMIKLDPAGAGTVILKLSGLLRHSIDNRVSEVRLDSDVTHIRNYLDILKYRFGSRFDYTLETDPRAEACLVPKLIVQPLMENAVEHGFGNREQLRVTFTATVRDSVLHITICDNGEGVNESRLAELRAMLREPTNSTNFIGLYNAHRRITLLHGQAFGLDIDSKEGQGTVVRVTMPAKTV